MTNEPDSLVPETGRAALRGLFDRLREHVAQAEDATDDALDAFEPVLASDPEKAADLLHAPRTAALDVARTVAKLDALRSIAPEEGACVLCRLTAELQVRAARLDARLAAAEAAVERARAGLASRLDAWDAAAARCDGELAARLSEQLTAGERQRDADLTGLIAMAGRRRVPQSDAASPRRRPQGRPAALLLSAGVACLGLATLAVVLEPPFSPGPSSDPAGARAEIVLRGPIFVAPPRLAAIEEFAEQHATTPLTRDAERQLAASIAAFEQGRPGAVAQLRRLGEAGIPRAQMYLARIYEVGRGVPADSAEARRWTARAADGGDAVALHNLALYYLEGRGGPRDDAVAAQLFRRSARAGVADSQFNLGLLYESGAGVERNLTEAYRWFQIAANGGDLKARERAVALEPRLSAKEIASAERLAADFRPGAGEVEVAVLIPGAATVADSQKKLARLGFYIGPTDGQDSPAYRQAVEAYRRGERTRSAAIGGPGDF